MSYTSWLTSKGALLNVPMSDVSGSVCTDVSGNNRHGAYMGGCALGQDSIVPNLPGDFSVGFDGIDDFVFWASAAWMNVGANFTILFPYKPRSFALQEDIIGRTNSWQLWQETTGKLQCHLSPAWTSFLSTNPVVLNSDHLIGIRQDAVTGKASIWINGIKNGEVNKATALTNIGDLRFGVCSVANRFVNCRGQGLAIFDTALSDADMLEAYTQYADAPEPPVAPSDIVVTPSVTITTITWTAAPTLLYTGEYWDGFTWRSLFAYELGLDHYDWDASKRRGDAKIRIRSKNVDAAVSAWVESGTFALPGRVMGSYWRAILLHPEAGILWKLNENAANNVVADSTVNARNATATGNTNLLGGFDTLISNRPNDKAFRRVAASSGFIVNIALSAWMANVRSVLVNFRPRVGMATGTLWTVFGPLSAQVLSTGAIRLAANPAGGVNNLDTGAGEIVLNTPYHLAFTASTPVMQIFKNGVRKANGSGPSSFNALSAGIGVLDAALNQDLQGTAFFTKELDALEITWLYDASVGPPNEVPTDPGAFTEPLGANFYDAAINVAWGASVDPEGFVVEYYGEYTRDAGATWQQLFDWQLANTYAWDTSTILFGDGFQIRVKARDTYLEESAWRTSGTFTIEHIAVVAGPPDIIQLYRGYSNIGLQIVFNHANGQQHYKTEYKADAAGSPTLTREETDDMKEFVLLHVPKTAWEGVISARTIDYGGNVSEWTELAYRRRNYKKHSGTFPFKYRDHSGNGRHGNAVIYTGSGTYFESGGAGGLPDWSEARVPPQLAGGLDIAVKHVAVEASGPATVRFDDDETPFWVSPADKNAPLYSMFAAFNLGAYRTREDIHAGWVNFYGPLVYGKELFGVLGSIRVHYTKTGQILCFLQGARGFAFNCPVGYNLINQVNVFNWPTGGLLQENTLHTLLLSHKGGGGIFAPEFDFAMDEDFVTIGQNIGLCDPTDPLLDNIYWSHYVPRSHPSIDRHIIEIFNANGGLPGHAGGEPIGTGTFLEFIIYRNKFLSEIEYGNIRNAILNNEDIPNYGPYLHWRFRDPDIPITPVSTASVYGGVLVG